MQAWDDIPSGFSGRDQAKSIVQHIRNLHQQHLLTADVKESPKQRKSSRRERRKAEEKKLAAYRSKQDKGSSGIAKYQCDAAVRRIKVRRNGVIVLVWRVFFRLPL